MRFHYTFDKRSRTRVFEAGLIKIKKKTNNKSGCHFEPIQKSKNRLRHAPFKMKSSFCMESGQVKSIFLRYDPTGPNYVLIQYNYRKVS